MPATPPPIADTMPDATRALLARPETRVYKQDRRSRVWLVEDDAGKKWVIKRFEHRRFKQKLTARLGVHPAQQESNWHEKLAAAGLPVVPIAAAGVDEQGRQWLVTPWVGDDLVMWIQAGRLTVNPTLRHDIIRQLGKLAGRLLQMRLFYRDFKARNLVIDDAGKVWLIDAGGCRGGKGTPLLALALRMLKLLHRTARDAAIDSEQKTAQPSRADRMRFYCAMLTAWPRLPDGLQHLPRSKEFE